MHALFRSIHIKITQQQQTACISMLSFIGNEKRRLYRLRSKSYFILWKLLTRRPKKKREFQLQNFNAKACNKNDNAKDQNSSLAMLHMLVCCQPLSEMHAVWDELVVKYLLLCRGRILWGNFMWLTAIQQTRFWKREKKILWTSSHNVINIDPCESQVLWFKLQIFETLWQKRRKLSAIIDYHSLNTFQTQQVTTISRRRNPTVWA